MAPALPPDELENYIPPPPKCQDMHTIKLYTQEEERIEAAWRHHCQNSFSAFFRGIRIEAGGQPRQFENVGAMFQREFFEDVTPHIEASRNGTQPTLRRFWCERTKKASKDADIAVIILWLMCFPTRPYYAQIGAADKEQANIVKERIEHLLYWNDWLNAYVEVNRYEVKSKKTNQSGNSLARTEILSSDIAGAHGGTPDLMIVNELSHVTRWEFVENLMDNADGVPHGIIIVATNAGFRGTKAESWRINAMRSDGKDGSLRWSVHVLSKPAPWHSKAVLAEAKKRNPRSRYKRLWQGIWASGKGDAVREDAIERAFVMPGPLTAPEEGYDYVLGLDLGVSHDHCGFMCLGVSMTQRKIKTAVWARWKPPIDGGEIQLVPVMNYIKRIYRTFKAAILFYDPHQAVLMAQMLRKEGLVCEEVSFSSHGNLTRMASAYMEVLSAGVMECYDDTELSLQQDFGKLSIVEKPYGFRLEAVSDESGHADVATALLIALPFARDALEGLVNFDPTDEVMSADDVELSEEELKAVPGELKELMDLEDQEGARHRGRPTITQIDFDPLGDLE